MKQVLCARNQNTGAASMKDFFRTPTQPNPTPPAAAAMRDDPLGPPSKISHRISRSQQIRSKPFKTGAVCARHARWFTACFVEGLILSIAERLRSSIWWNVDLSPRNVQDEIFFFAVLSDKLK
jgi:hypothetical protein